MCKTSLQMPRHAIILLHLLLEVGLEQFLCALVGLCRRRGRPFESAGQSGSQAIPIGVVTADERFGHKLNESGGHSLWRDGECRIKLDNRRAVFATIHPQYPKEIDPGTFVIDLNRESIGLFVSSDGGRKWMNIGQDICPSLGMHMDRREVCLIETTQDGSSCSTIRVFMRASNLFANKTNECKFLRSFLKGVVRK